MTAVTLAWLVLSYLGVASVWDILDPRAAKLDIKPGRLIVACLAQIALICLCLVTLAAAPVAYVVVFGALIILSLVKLVVHGEV